MKALTEACYFWFLSPGRTVCVSQRSSDSTPYLLYKGVCSIRELGVQVLVPLNPGTASQLCLAGLINGRSSTNMHASQIPSAFPLPPFLSSLLSILSFIMVWSQLPRSTLEVYFNGDCSGPPPIIVFGNYVLIPPEPTDAEGFAGVWYVVTNGEFVGIFTKWYVVFSLSPSQFILLITIAPPIGSLPKTPRLVSRTTIKRRRSAGGTHTSSVGDSSRCPARLTLGG